jgi:hypothetical protein
MGMRTRLGCLPVVDAKNAPRAKKVGAQRPMKTPECRSPVARREMDVPIDTSPET